MINSSFLESILPYKNKNSAVSNIYLGFGGEEIETKILVPSWPTLARDKKRHLANKGGSSSCASP